MAGLRFYKLDLHAHTPASKCYLDKNDTATDIVHSAIEKGLNGIAVTDHNTAEWIDVMKKAAEETELVIFPGVELSLEQGHLVALFDPSCTQKDIEGLLGRLDIKPSEFGKSETVCTKNVYEVVEIIHERGGLAVLAHIDQIKGIFFEEVKVRDVGKVSVPASLSKILNEADYDAVECVDGKLPAGFDEAHQIKRKPAFYQASDNPDPANPVKHSKDGLAARFSWFKMDSINLEGLRQCFADPEVRIQLMGKGEDMPYHRIVSLRMGENGFLHHQNFAFHEGLNSLIGGKGVGKSLAIEFLRFGLNQSSTDESILKDHIKKLQKRLMPGNTVEIVYQLSDGAQFKIVRQFEGPSEKEHSLEIRGTTTCINLATGDPYLGDIPTTFPVLAYSQTEVINIAENKPAQLELIDQFIDTRSLEQEILQTQESLRENDIALDRSLQAKTKLAEAEREIQTLGLKIDSISKALSNPLFNQMKAGETKKDALDAQKEYAGGLARRLRVLAQEFENISSPSLPGEIADDTLLKTQNKLVEQARAFILSGIGHLLIEIEKIETAMAEANEGWLPEFQKIKTDYEQLLKDIGGDQEAKDQERKKLTKSKDGFEKDAGQYRAQNDALPSIWEERQRLLSHLEKVYEKIFQLRKDKFDHLTRLSDNKLDLVLEHSADRSVFEEKLVDLLKGGANSLTVGDRRKIAQNVRPRRFVELLIDRKRQELASEAQISEPLAEKVIEKLWSSDDFVEILALQHNCYPGDVPTIYYRKEGGEYAELSELSIGQKCTALLIIALCDGTMPVVIDQPEDALDIISVWEDIAKKLRRGKNSRQFILTTHNSSVAVAADSDQFIVLKAGANSGRVVAAGAIDRLDVREAVIAHLEGGTEPYKLRLQKYNIPS